jgi:hypothetical protein
MLMFSSYQGARASSILMGNGSAAPVLGVGTVEVKLTSRKTVHLRNMQHAPSINMNLISGSLLCRDSYKLVFEFNKVLMSKFDTLLVKAMKVEACSA